MLYYYLNCFLILFGVLCGPGVLHAAVISSSRLEMCSNTGSEDEGLSCQKKFVVTVAIDAGSTGGTESVVIEGAQDGDGERYKMEPLTLSIAKTPVRALYPLTYRDTYSYNANERIVYQSNAFKSACRDDPEDDHPTCGWQYTGDGTQVESSQGFCCNCPFVNLGQPDDRTRGGLNCAFFGKVSSSAHCLDLDPLLFQSFTPGAAQQAFNVSLTLRPSDPSLEPLGKVHLSPSRPSAVLLSDSIIARLAGDLAAWQELPVLENKNLIVPWKPDSHRMVENRGNFTLLVPNTALSPSGAECNRIGTSYAAFRFQSDGCKQPPGSCLEGQIKDYIDGDLDRISQGRDPEYLLMRQPQREWHFEGRSEREEVFLSLHTTRTQATMLTLTIDADAVSYVVNTAPGRIQDAFVEDFEAFSRDGVLHAVVKNTGSIVADFTLSVVACSSNILPVEARRFSAAPQEHTPLKMGIRSQAGLEVDNRCLVRLYDSQETLQDEVEVLFTSTEIRREEKNGTVDDSDVERDSAPPETGSGCNCHMLKPSCYTFGQVIRGCWSIFQGLILAAFILTVVLLVVLVFRYPRLALRLLKLMAQLLCCPILCTAKLTAAASSESSSSSSSGTTREKKIQSRKKDGSKKNDTSRRRKDHRSYGDPVLGEGRSRMRNDGDAISTGGGGNGDNDEEENDDDDADHSNNDGSSDPSYDDDDDNYPEDPDPDDNPQYQRYQDYASRRIRLYYHHPYQGSAVLDSRSFPQPVPAQYTIQGILIPHTAVEAYLQDRYQSNPDEAPLLGLPAAGLHFQEEDYVRERGSNDDGNNNDNNDNDSDGWPGKETEIPTADFWFLVRPGEQRYAMTMKGDRYRMRPLRRPIPLPGECLLTPLTVRECAAMLDAKGPESMPINGTTGKGKGKGKGRRGGKKRKRRIRE